MKYLALLSLISLTACASGPQRPQGFQPKLANPSAVIAAEIAFNRLAQERGQWTAFRETAAKDATMFVPQPVNAQDWLKGRENPAGSVKWQPHKAFMSCDGKTGVTTGAAQWPDGRSGYFTTVWQLFQPPEFIETRVASCKGAASAPLQAPAEGAKMKMGLSRDQSLNYTWVVQPDGARTLEVKLWNGQGFDSVLLDKVAAE
jgi:hypothetical protein